MARRRFWPNSLTSRISLTLMGVQTGCALLAFLAFPLVAPYTSYGRIADNTVRHLVTASLARGRDGALEIHPTASLRAYAASRPALSYAVVQAGHAPAPGSMPDLAAFLAGLSPAIPKLGGVLQTDRPGPVRGVAFITVDRTGFGDLTFATAGNAFRLDDVPTFLGLFLPTILPAYGPMLIGFLVILPIMLRRMLQPLRKVAQAASQIDLRALDQRLPTTALPEELRPAISAINTALDRVEGGWARQNLFTANAAHELRTPVAIIQARIDSMAPDAPDRAMLARDARRLRLLVDQLLTIARLDRPDAAPDKPVDLVTIVRAVVADCAPLALRGGRAVAFHADALRVIVPGDARAIEGAVSNLIDNALRAEPVGGTVDVMVHDSRGGCIEVRDHGAGIAVGERLLVFEPFWRKDDRSAGTGLGLAAVREVARLHGGGVCVVETPGGGATFKIEFSASRAVR